MMVRARFSLPVSQRCMLLLVACFFSASLGWTESTSVLVPAGTSLPLQTKQHVPMKVGQKIEANLLYPIFAENKVVIPAGTMVRGTVVELAADHHRRVRSRFDGDFTPFHIPSVHFDELVLADGTEQQFSSSNATNGAPLVRLNAPLSKTEKESILSKEIAQAKQQAKDRIAVLTGPDKGDRLLQMAYHQLPYHPERIEKGTAWTVELSEPLTLRKDAFPSTPKSTVQEGPAAAAAASAEKKEWLVDAYLKENLSSAISKQGSEVQARVAEPVFNPDHTVAVPEGALLIGTVTRATPARSFGRRGQLRFDFREIRLPEGQAQRVDGILAAAAVNTNGSLQMNSEGAVQPKAKDRIIMPLVLSLLATRAFDNDGNQAANGAVASNGLGLVGRVVGAAAGSRNIAAGIGIYGTALALYDRWIARGQDVSFNKGTRLEVLTLPSRNVLSHTSK